MLAGSNAVTRLVNEKSREEVSFYRRAGYKLRLQYDTIFLHTGR